MKVQDERVNHSAVRIAEALYHYLQLVHQHTNCPIFACSLSNGENGRPVADSRFLRAEAMVFTCAVVITTVATAGARERQCHEHSLAADSHTGKAWP